MISLEQFVIKYNRRKVGTGQCVALIKQYEKEVLGFEPQAVGNAHDYFDNYENTPFLKEHFIKIPKTPGAMPQYRDMVVWNTNMGGGYGHIAIAYENIGENQFRSFDQNWSKKERCALENHSYNNVSGWLRPRKTPVPPKAEKKKNFNFLLFRKMKRF